MSHNFKNNNFLEGLFEPVVPVYLKALTHKSVKGRNNESVYSPKKYT